jgi:CRISPR-associated protein Cmr6
MIPISETTQKLLQARTSNFGLFFYRMTPWQLDHEVPKKQKDFIEVQNDWVSRYVPALDLLDRRHTMQSQYLREVEQQGGASLTIEAELTSPFVSGLGSGHPSETGLVLDRNLGCVYLPAHSIKGVMKHAQALHLLQQLAEIYQWRTDEDLIQAVQKIPLPVRRDNGKKTDDGAWIVNDAFPGLQNWFGSLPGTQYKPDAQDPQGIGRLVVLDAFPRGDHRLEADILNPHYPHYYQDKGRKKGPTEDQDPHPITFLQVPKGVRFIFRFAFLPQPLLDDESWGQTKKEELRRELLDVWRRAAELGFGGKTSIGYGRFKAVSFSCSSESEEASSSKDRDRRETQPDAKVLGLSPVEKLKKELAMIKPDDAGRIGTMLQKIAALETAAEKAQMARAVREHLGEKRFNKHKRKGDLLRWMEADIK